MLCTRSIPRLLLTGAVAVLPACGESAPPLGPDGLPAISSEATRWLEANVVRLEPLDPTAGLEDLEPLRAMIGPARLVALGEATHGTREFFLAKHRILRFLVEEMGFQALAMEASWPEGHRIDEYVRTGAGDPEILLSGLYTWTWNTQEVLDVVRWLRERNQRVGESAVRYFGFDMQFPGMAIQMLEVFVAEHDPSFLPEVAKGVDCLERFTNDPTGRFPEPGYADQLRQAYRDPCRESLDAVYLALLARQTSLEESAGPLAFALALQSARVAIQFEDYVSSRTANARDLYMAENVSWILDRLGPAGRLVVWAHDDHVANRPGAMGRFLRIRHPGGVALVGSTFFRGRFNAEAPGAGTRSGIPDVYSIAQPLPFAYGHYFDSPGIPRFLLDLTGPDLGDPAAMWLAGPRPLRNIGLDFDPSEPDRYFRQSRLAEEFDVVLYVRDSTPSTLMPFRFPEVFRTSTSVGSTR